MQGAQRGDDLLAVGPGGAQVEDRRVQVGQDHVVQLAARAVVEHLRLGQPPPLQRQQAAADLLARQHVDDPLGAGLRDLDLLLGEERAVLLLAEQQCADRAVRAVQGHRPAQRAKVDPRHVARPGGEIRRQGDGGGVQRIDQRIAHQLRGAAQCGELPLPHVQHVAAQHGEQAVRPRAVRRVGAEEAVQPVIAADEGAKLRHEAVTLDERPPAAHCQEGHHQQRGEQQAVKEPRPPDQAAPDQHRVAQRQHQRAAPQPGEAPAGQGLPGEDLVGDDCLPDQQDRQPDQRLNRQVVPGDVLHHNGIVVVGERGEGGADRAADEP